MTSGDRVLQARQICGLTQSELAHAIGVEQAYVSMIERGQRDPSPAILQAIAFRTGFSFSFFQQPPGPIFPAGSLLYRRRKSAKSDDLDKLLQVARLSFELHESLACRFKERPLQLPRSASQPEEAAGQTRQALGIFSSDSPITSLIRRLERVGVVVIPVPFSVEHFDSFSLWADSDPAKPVLVVSTDKSGDRQRFSICHELGHLVLHRNSSRPTEGLEVEANLFAGALLLPENVARRELVAPLTLDTLLRVKAEWGISISATVQRALALGLITDRQRRYWMQRLAMKKWLKSEPVHVQVEKPRLLMKMAEVLYGAPVSPERIASETGWPSARVQQLLALYSGKMDDRAPSKGPKTKAMRDIPLLRFPAKHTKLT